MNFLAAFSHPEWADSPSARHYQDLIAQAASARKLGDHWKAQQLASRAHQWAVNEWTRLQRLEQAEAWLAETTKRLNRCWDQDRSCTTIDELRANHPEFKRVITTWEAARERVRELIAEGPESATLKA